MYEMHRGKAPKKDFIEQWDEADSKMMAVSWMEKVKLGVYVATWGNRTPGVQGAVWAGQRAWGGE